MKCPWTKPFECQSVRYTARDGEADAYREARTYLLFAKTGPTVMRMTPREIAKATTSRLSAEGHHFLVKTTQQAAEVPFEITW